MIFMVGQVIHSMLEARQPLPDYHTYKYSSVQFASIYPRMCMNLLNLHLNLHVHPISLTFQVPPSSWTFLFGLRRCFFPVEGGTGHLSVPEISC